MSRKEETKTGKKEKENFAKQSSGAYLGGICACPLGGENKTLY